MRFRGLEGGGKGGRRERRGGARPAAEEWVVGKGGPGLCALRASGSCVRSNMPTPMSTPCRPRQKAPLSVRVHRASLLV